MMRSNVIGIYGDYYDNDDIVGQCGMCIQGAAHAHAIHGFSKCRKEFSQSHHRQLYPMQETL